MNRDVITASISDMHSGGLTALFPNYQMVFEYDNNNRIPYMPTGLQLKLYDHWIYCADVLKKKAKGKKMVIVFNGDAIEGAHHNTIQIISARPSHQGEIFTELFETFLARSGFSVKNGDELYFIAGTESHTGWEEFTLKKKFDVLGAKYGDELKLKINGKNLWWKHEGAQPGKGTNEGNAIRNFARDIYWDCIKEGKEPPHLITNSHYHKASYDSYNNSYRHTVHCQVLPSWQMKTRYGHRASNFQRNDIGMTFNEITKDGNIIIGEPLLMESRESSD